MARLTEVEVRNTFEIIRVPDVAEADAREVPTVVEQTAPPPEEPIGERPMMGGQFAMPMTREDQTDTTEAPEAAPVEESA